MRIAIFTEVFLPKIDGITNRLANTITQLKAEGHDVLVFAPLGTVDSFCGCQVVKISGVPFRPYPGTWFVWPSPKILAELGRFRPDIVHAVGPAALGLWGSICSRLLGIPLISSYHTDFPAYSVHYKLGWLRPHLWRCIRWVHNFADINLCLEA